MYQSIPLLLILWLTLASKVRNENDEVKNLAPLILSPSGKPDYERYDEVVYRLPVKVRSKWLHEQVFYYDKEKDGQFFCPVKTGVTGESKYHNCLAEQTFEENEKKVCEKEVKPVLVEEKDSLSGIEVEVSCGGTGILYAAAYKVCQQKIYQYINSSRTEPWYQIYYSTPTYEVCYDYSQERVLFAKHRILTPNIFRKANLKDETALYEFPQQYSTETEGSANFKNLKNRVKAYEEQENSENKQQFRMLVPTDDFALGHWMKTTFHITNYALLHRTKVPVWNAINSYVKSWALKKKFDETTNPLIFTGTFVDEKSVDENKDNLHPRNGQSSGIIIPKLWWKLLYSEKYEKGVVIIMHNDDNSTKICDPEVTACHVSKWKTDQLKEEDIQNVYCCSLSSASKSIPILNHLVINLEFGVMKLV